MSWRRRRADAPPRPDPPPTVSVFDAAGRRYEVAADTWRAQVLPDALREAWDDPDELANRISDALRHALAADVLAAARRLHEIDPDRGRSGVLLGVCLYETRDLPAAERVLRAVVDEVPSAAAWTNLAKVASGLGRPDEVVPLLRRALDADPNFDNALQWYGALEREQHGSSGWSGVMAEMARRPGAWRPQLWLGRDALQDGDVHGALAWYRQALDRAPDEGDALMTATGDLGNAGRLDDVLALGLPRWRPEVHGPAAGHNLLEAALQLERVDDAADVLHRLYALELPYLGERLRPQADRVDALRARRHRALAADVDPGRAQIGLLATTDPLWWRPLADPAWLHAAAAGSVAVAFLPLWSRETEGTEARVMRTEWRGAACRGTPLYLADRARANGATAATLQPVVVGGGVVLTGAPFEPASIRRLLDEAAVTASLVVTGSLGGTEQSPWVELVVTDGAADREVATLRRTGLGDAWPVLAAALAEHGVPVEARSEADPNVVASLVGGQEKVLNLVLAARGLVPADTLWGERGMLDWLLAVRFDNPSVDTATLSYAAALVANRGYGSPIWSEYRQRTFRLLDEKPSPLSERLRPLFDALFETGKVTPATGEPAYDAWLGRLYHGFWYP